MADAGVERDAGRVVVSSRVLDTAREGGRDSCLGAIEDPRELGAFALSAGVGPRRDLLVREDIREEFCTFTGESIYTMRGDKEANDRFGLRYAWSARANKILERGYVGFGGRNL